MDKVPLTDKLTLSVVEASELSGIGQHKIRELLSEPTCTFVLYIGNRNARIKRKKFEKFLEERMAI